MRELGSVIDDGAVRLPSGKRVYTKFYAYATARFALGAQNAAATANIQIEKGADFLIEKLTFFADANLAAQTYSTRVIPLITVLMVDTATGDRMFNNPVTLGALFGDGREPYILPRPFRLKAAGTLQVNTVNLEAAATNNIQFVFSGRKVIELGPE